MVICLISCTISMCFFHGQVAQASHQSLRRNTRNAICDVPLEENTYGEMAVGLVKLFTFLFGIIRYHCIDFLITELIKTRKSTTVP